MLPPEPPADGPEGWVYLRTAPDQLQAEMWRERLESLAIPARLAPADVISFLGVSCAPCRLLVPAGLRAAAEHVLAEEL
jgi:hypothetical protein